MNNSKGNSGLSFPGLLTIVFIILKLVNVINWSWLWVLSPLWISVVLTVIVLIIIELNYGSHKSKRCRSDKLKW